MPRKRKLSEREEENGQQSMMVTRSRGKSEAVSSQEVKKDVKRVQTMKEEAEKPEKKIRMTPDMIIVQQLSTPSEEGQSTESTGRRSARIGKKASDSIQTTPSVDRSGETVMKKKTVEIKQITVPPARTRGLSVITRRMVANGVKEEEMEDRNETTTPKGTTTKKPSTRSDPDVRVIGEEEGMNDDIVDGSGEEEKKKEEAENKKEEDVSQCEMREGMKKEEEQTGKDDIRPTENFGDELEKEENEMDLSTFIGDSSDDTLDRSDTAQIVIGVVQSIVERREKKEEGEKSNLPGRDEEKEEDPIPDETDGHSVGGGDGVDEGDDLLEKSTVVPSLMDSREEKEEIPLKAGRVDGEEKEKEEGMEREKKEEPIKRRESVQPEEKREETERMEVIEMEEVMPSIEDTVVSIEEKTIDIVTLEDTDEEGDTVDSSPLMDVQPSSVNTNGGDSSPLSLISLESGSDDKQEEVIEIDEEKSVSPTIAPVPKSRIIMEYNVPPSLPGNIIVGPIWRETDAFHISQFFCWIATVRPLPVLKHSRFSFFSLNFHSAEKEREIVSMSPMVIGKSGVHVQLPLLICLYYESQRLTLQHVEDFLVSLFTSVCVVEAVPMDSFLEWEGRRLDGRALAKMINHHEVSRVMTQPMRKYLDGWIRLEVLTNPSMPNPCRGPIGNL